MMKRGLSFLPWFALVLALPACATLRGRADDALERGDYRRAVDLYTVLNKRDPGDKGIKSLLTRSERGLLDQKLAAAEAARKAGDASDALQKGIEVLNTKDEIHADAIDKPRADRIAETAKWGEQTLRAAIGSEAGKGRALVARAIRTNANLWFSRPELGNAGAEVDASIAAAGLATCSRAHSRAGDAPFSLEIVASYCKAWNGPMPAWRPRPLLVGSTRVSGTILGTPPGEMGELERSVREAVERSVWFSPTATQHASAFLSGNVDAAFTRAPVELTRGWTERIPYQATETYQEPISVPYWDTETYHEQQPYTDYETRYEPCGSSGSRTCAVSHPVTRYRTVSRTRQVRKTRTEYQTRTRVVTRYRDEPRVFRYTATKHEAAYVSAFLVRLDLGAGAPPLEARGGEEKQASGLEHDVEFAPASVHPERPNFVSALAFRKTQRERVRDAVLASLDRGWETAFCTEAVGQAEDAARCAHARPRDVPKAVLARIGELVGDDAALILELPRPREAVQ